MINFFKGLYELIFNSKITRGEHTITTLQFMLFSWLFIQLIITILSIVITLILGLF